MSAEPVSVRAKNIERHKTTFFACQNLRILLKFFSD